MTKQNDLVSITVEQQIGIITIDYPPVNALGQKVRLGLVKAVEQLENDQNCQIIIIQCVGKTFIAGADIKEFGAPAVEPHLPDVVNRIEASTKPVVASLFGTTLGGGLEVAMACHYRLALAISKVGLPEVNLGLIPGAGGTQRLTRLIGVDKALEMICSGKHYQVTTLKDSGLFDEIFVSEKNNDLDFLQQQTVNFCQQLIADNNLTVKPVGNRKVDTENFDWDSSKAKVIKSARGRIAPVTAFEIIQNTCHMTITEGMAVERQEFIKLRESEQSKALRHAFAAEKKAAKLSFNATTLTVKTVGIIGGGTMGAGICTNFLNVGYKVCLIEQTDEAAQAAYDRIATNIAGGVKRGRINQQQADNQLAALNTNTDKNSLQSCQLIIEAVFEDIEVKKVLFKELDNICEPSTIFATNTSYLDINEIAAATNRPDKVIGMHFFSPAHIMKLLEVVQADKSSDTSLATAMAVGKKLGKVSVLVKVCFGFAGNRMYSRYGREIQQMLLEGATVEQIDTAMTRWGMAMGPLAVQDLSGIDIGYNARKTRPMPEHDPGYFRAAAAMVEHGRLGRKTGAGFYRYDEQGKSHSDAEVATLITDKAVELDINQHVFTDDEIIKRALYALISEGLQLFKDGIVQRLSDIDVIWLHGYGFPRYRGGPMFQAQNLGKDVIDKEMASLQNQFGKAIWPKVNYEN